MIEFLLTLLPFWLRAGLFLCAILIGCAIGRIEKR